MRNAVATALELDIDAFLESLSAVDLSRVRMKLEDDRDGAAWPPERTRRVELLYRRFLALTWAYPAVSIVPSREIDEFWHQHILDTRAYARDTAAVFGEFLHHYPYFGMGGAEDRQRLEQAYERTKQLYAQHWGADQSGDCAADFQSGYCGTKECSACSKE